MPQNIKYTALNAMEAVSAVNATLRRIDERLVDHGNRVAYIACKICQKGNLGLDLKTLYLLSAFHDIGAYKTDEIDFMLDFETKNIWNHSIYGYIFLKHMTPLSECAKAVLNHHTAWRDLKDDVNKYNEYAALIHLADRLDVSNSYHNYDLIDILANTNDSVCNEYLTFAKECIEQDHILTNIDDGSYHTANEDLIKTFSTTAKEALSFLEMIVYSIDFRSEHTVTHTINTVSLALNIAAHFALSKEEMEKIYLGALLHDVGKISIPTSILESPGRLSDADMEIMRTHVTETRQIITGIVPKDICELAGRHHEKLDGSGYPEGLTAKDLTFAQRIVAVADIVSALSTRRSYKEPFPKEKTLHILKHMSGTQLDSSICDYICSDYDSILEKTEPQRLHVIQKYQQMEDEYQELCKIYL